MSTSDYEPEIDEDGLYDAVQVEDGHVNWEKLTQYVKSRMTEAYEQGRTDVRREGAARFAILEGQSYWLEEAEKSETTTMRSVARVIADAFAQWADHYRISTRPTLDSDNNGDNEVANFFEREGIEA